MPSESKAQKRLEEEARRQEELRKKAQEVAEKLYKQHDRERVVMEKTDKSKREQEQQRLIMERERLAQEKAEYAKIGSEKDYRLQLALREWNKHESWRRIIDDTWLPNVSSEADINAFLSVWSEESNDAAEDSKRNLDIDFKLMDQAYDLTQEILLKQDEGRVLQVTNRKAGFDQIQFHRRNLLNIYDMMLQKLDHITANMLQFLDKYVDRDEEQGITLCKESKAIRYGLWAGDKRPRHRGVDYRELGVSIGPKEGAYLPKALDLVKERGVRVMQLFFDPMTLRGEADPMAGSQYHALGCVIYVEALQYPKLPIQVKEWTLRHETALAHSIVRHPYPPPQTTDPEGAKPIRISFVVPNRVVVRHLAPFIGIWCEEEKCWQMQGTSDFDYKRETRTVTFATQYLACMAIIQERGFDVPYESWFMHPIDEDEVIFIIEGRRRGEISDREIHIQLRENRCRVIAPEEAELEYLREGWFAPATLLRHLSDSGYNFLFTDGDAQYFPDVLPKEPSMELRAYKDIAHFCTVHAFASSRHNAARPGLQPGITCEDPTQALFRISKGVRAEDAESAYKPDPDDDENWHTVRYETHRCVFTACSEASDVPDIQDAPGQESHLNLYTALCAASPDPSETTRRYDNGNLLLHSAVFEILSLTRPLSFG